ncbi:MAG: hypothetical protein SGI86_06765 [Deltaproteobacteria bacterium]|nr:hypothetical protein [Deltaproteobacteria bacterium]
MSEPLFVRLGYQDLDTFVTRFAPNVTRTSVFIASKTPRPVGEEFRFEISLVGGPAALSGQGRVTWVREFDPDAPRQPFGMGVQFVELDPQCQPLLEQLLVSRESRGRRASAIPARPMGDEQSRPTEKSFDLIGIDAQVSDESIARAIRFARSLAAKGGDDLDALLRDDPEAAAPSASLSEALSGLSDFVRPRTRSGLFQIPPELLRDKDGD